MHLRDGGLRAWRGRRRSGPPLAAPGADRRHPASSSSSDGGRPGAQASARAARGCCSCSSRRERSSRSTRSRVSCGGGADGRPVTSARVPPAVGTRRAEPRGRTLGGAGASGAAATRGARRGRRRPAARRTRSAAAAIPASGRHRGRSRQRRAGGVPGSAGVRRRSSRARQPALAFAPPCDRSIAARVMRREPQPGQVTTLSGFASGPIGPCSEGSSWRAEREYNVGAR